MQRLHTQDEILKPKYHLIRHTNEITNDKNEYSLIIRRAFINEKIKKLICDEVIKEILGDEACLNLYKDMKVEKIHIKNPRLAWSNYCAKKFPKQPKNIISITGTNGKTSSCYYISQILNQMNIPNLFIGTIGIYKNGEKIISLPNSTPDAYIIHEELNFFASEYPDGFAIIETTSVGIEEYRTHNIHSQIALVTNLTTDHLDYHPTAEDYFKAKLKLSKYTDKFLIHNSVKQTKYSQYGNELIDVISNQISSIFTYKIDNTIHKISLNLLGEFNAKNVLTAILALKEFFPIENFELYLKNLKPADGRLNRYNNIIIDFAHTLDAVENIFKAVKEYNKNKIITVIGFGGDLDDMRLTQISKFLQKNSDIVIITNDNPRNQDPMEIAKQSQAFCTKATIELDREKAIRNAYQIATDKDIIFILSKGHETYIEYENGRTVPFSDKEIVLKIINEQKYKHSPGLKK